MKEGGIELDASQIRRVGCTEYVDGRRQAQKVVSWYVHRCSHPLQIGRHESSLSFLIQPWGGSGSVRQAKLRGLLLGCIDTEFFN